jgi:ipoprotein LpqH
VSPPARPYIRCMRIGALALIAGLVATCAACSSEPKAAPLPDGVLPAGTAQITVDGRDGGTSHEVQCSAMGFQTAITTGNQSSGTTALVSGGDGLTAESVGIRDLAGFTGNYNAGLGEAAAEVTMAGPTFVITGTATGFRTDAPSFTTDGTFTLRVSC